MNDLKARGVEDILIAVVDGLKGFPEAIEAVFPQAAIQTCIVGSLKKWRTASLYGFELALAPNVENHAPIGSMYR
jgi:putative transposase